MRARYPREMPTLPANSSCVQPRPSRAARTRCPTCLPIVDIVTRKVTSCQAGKARRSSVTESASTSSQQMRSNGVMYAALRASSPISQGVPPRTQIVCNQEPDRRSVLDIVRVAAGLAVEVILYMNGLDRSHQCAPAAIPPLVLFTGNRHYPVRVDPR